MDCKSNCDGLAVSEILRYTSYVHKTYRQTSYYFFIRINLFSKGVNKIKLKQKFSQAWDNRFESKYRREYRRWMRENGAIAPRNIRYVKAMDLLILGSDTRLSCTLML